MVALTLALVLCSNPFPLPAVDGKREDWAKVRKVELSDDGKSLFISASQCGMDASDDDSKNEIPMADLDAKRIQVLGDKDTVQLRGRVHTWYEKRLAEREAAAAPGVSRVDNQIVVEAA